MSNWRPPPIDPIVHAHDQGYLKGYADGMKAMTVYVVIELSTGVAMPYVFSTFEAANEWLTFGPAPQPRAGYIVACEMRR